MYKLFVIIFLLLSFRSSAQITLDTSSSISSKWGMGTAYAPGITIWNDGTVEIRGDTAENVRRLYKAFSLMQESAFLAEQLTNCFGKDGRVYAEALDLMKKRVIMLKKAIRVQKEELHKLMYKKL